MRQSNGTHLLGRLTKDIEVKTVGEDSVVRFTLAVNRPYQKDKERQADFIECEAWGAQATFLSKFFKKGDPVAIVGEIRATSWDGTDGKKMYRTFVRVDGVEFAITSNSGDNKKNYSDDSNPVKAVTPSLDIADGDLPF